MRVFENLIKPMRYELLFSKLILLTLVFSMLQIGEASEGCGERLSAQEVINIVTEYKQTSSNLRFQDERDTFLDQNVTQSTIHYDKCHTGLIESSGKIHQSIHFLINNKEKEIVSVRLGRIGSGIDCYIERDFTLSSLRTIIDVSIGVSDQYVDAGWLNNVCIYEYCRAFSGGRKSLRFEIDRFGEIIHYQTGESNRTWSGVKFMFEKYNASASNKKL